MVGTIRFPHLGIILEHVIRSVSIGNFEIACYGMVIAAAMVSGLLIVMKTAEYTGQDPDVYFDLGISAIIAALLSARIYYVIFSWDYYRVHLAEILNFRQGGLAIYGGVIGGVLSVLVFSHIRNISWTRALDTAVIGLVWGQMLGRWGNFFNREAFGDYTNCLLAMQLPVDDIRISEITAKMQEHILTLDGVQYVQVHPTFLYESLWNLGVFLILLFVTHRGKKRYPGKVFLLYLLLYGAGRFWIEGLRTDQLLLPGMNLPVSQILSGLLVIISVILLIIRKLGKGTNDHEKKGTVAKMH